MTGWTRETPTVAGAYWVRFHGGEPEAIELCGDAENMEALWAGERVEDVVRSDEDGFKPPDWLKDCEWYGPIQPPGAPLTDREASEALSAIRYEANRYISGVHRPLDDEDQPLPLVVTLDADFDLPTLRAIVAILERVTP